MEDAIQYLSQAVAIENLPVHKVFLAELYVKQGDFPKADEILVDILSKNRETRIVKRAYLTYAKSLYAQNKLDESKKAYDQVIELDPFFADAYFGIGKILFDKGLTAEARFQWREAIRLDPNHREALQYLQDDNN